MVHNACFMKTKQLKEELQQACVITSVEGYHHGYFSTDIRLVKAEEALV